MFKLIAPRDLAPIPAVAATAFVALAIFAWTERTIVVDPEGLSRFLLALEDVANCPFADGIRRGLVGLDEHATRSLGTEPGVGHVGPGGAHANGYSGLFGDHSGNVWRTVNPLFIGSSGVAAVVLWRCGCVAGRVGAVVSLTLGAPGICQRLLREQWNSLAGVGPGSDAYGAGLGRRRQPGQRRRHYRKRRVAG